MVGKSKTTNRAATAVLAGLAVLLVSPAAETAFAANPSGDLRIEVIAAYNLVVDSNVGTPSSKSPRCAYLGATFYNDGTNDLYNVFAYIGNFIDGTSDTPGVYPTNRSAVCYGPLPGGVFALTHEGGTAGTADATRYLGTIPAGESVTAYWLVSYPLMGTNTLGAPVPTWGTSVKPDDDLTLQYDVWGTAISAKGSNLTATVTRDVTMRNEISAMANKIFPNGANKVPQEYLDLLAQYAPQWTNVAANGSVGTRITIEGYWYDLGNVGEGFDNNGDLVPDRNAWMQPVGDPSIFDPSCFRLVKTHAMVVVKISSTEEIVYLADDQLYFEHIPPNIGAVGLVLYEYLPLKAGCTSAMTPYQEVASGRDNEKFNADFGATLAGALVSGEANVALQKFADPAVIAPGTNIRYSITFTNTSSQTVGDASLGVPLVITDAIPTGTVFVAASATNGNVPPAGFFFRVLYSTNNALTWATNEPPASQVTHVQWWLSDPLPSAASGTVRMTVTVLSSYSNGNPLVSNTAGASLGNTTPFTNSTVTTRVLGTNFLGDYVFVDNGGGTNFGNGVKDSDEPGLPNIRVNLYYDLNSNGVQDTADTLIGFTNSNGNGYYVFTNLLDGTFLAVVDLTDTDIPVGYTTTTSTWYSVPLDPTGGTVSAVAYTNADFGFAPAMVLSKTGPTATREGSTVTYTLSVTNRLPGNGGIATYTVWGTNATAAKTGGWTSLTNAATPTYPDGLCASNRFTTGADWMSVEGHSIGAQIGSITKVELIIPMSVVGSFVQADDTVTIEFGTNGVKNYEPDKNVLYSFKETLTNLYDRLRSQFPDGNYLIDVTGSNAWTWESFGAGYKLAIGVQADKVGSKSDGPMLCVDQAGFRITTDQSASISSNAASTLNPVPMTDTYNTNLLRYVSASVEPTTVTNDGALGILYWANVGPIYAGGSKTITVTYYVPEPPNNATSVVTNTVFVTNATYASGRPANVSTQEVVTTNSPAGSIGDLIWRDLNGNGVQDPGEPGLGNVAVELTPPPSVDVGNGAGKPITNYTDSTGYYMFTGLPSDGSYTVRVDTATLPSGGSTLFTNTWDRDGTNNSYCTNIVIDFDSQSGGDKVTNADFGYRFTNTTVEGTIWDDWNRSGTSSRDSGEGWLTNEVVRLYTNSASGTPVLASTTLATNGYFQFIGNYTGKLYVVVVTNSGAMTNTAWIQTFDSDGIVPPSTNIVTNTVVAGGYMRADFSYYRAGNVAIGDTLFYDWNGDRIQQPASEEGITGITVRLYYDRNTNGVVDIGVDPLISNVVTDVKGQYLFTNLAANITNYLVVVDQNDPQFPILHYCTADPYGANDGRSVVTNFSVSRYDQDFGYQPYGTASIGDTVFRDMDGSGTQSGPGETGISNVLVTLKVDFDGDGTYVTLRTTNTSATGYYIFQNLPAGNYRVEVSTTDTNLPKDSFSVPYRPSTATNYPFSLTNGQNRMDADFGFAPPAAIGDTLWWDANANGSQDWNEGGVTGVLVSLYLDANSNRLYDAGETLVASNWTDSAGHYAFTNLGPGRYVVVVNTNAPSLLNKTITGDPDADGDPNATTNSAGLGRDGQFGTTLTYGTAYMGADFGFVPSGVIGDRLWMDSDGDGVQDTGEVGIAYVTIELWSNATVIATNVTDADGYYIFSGYADFTNYWVRVLTNDTDFPLGLTATYAADYTLDNRTTNIVVSGGHITTITNGAWTGGDLGIDFGYRYAGNNRLIGTVGLETSPSNGVMGTGTNGVGAGEYPYAGVTLYLNFWQDRNGDGLRGQGEVVFINTALTATNGDYAFGDLPAAIGVSNYYIVSLSAPDEMLRLTTTTNSAVPSTFVSNFVDSSGFTLSAFQVIPVAALVTNVDFAFVSMAAHDYGDLPDSYDTLMPTGARHKVKASPTLYLGTQIDTEPNGQPTVDATGDNAVDRNDEDGVVPIGAWNAATNGGAVQVTASTNGWLVAFIDFGTNGVFTDVGDLILTQAVSAGTTTNVFAIPTNAAIAVTNVTAFYARFRLFDALPTFPALAFAGSADSGEVEDYRWQFGVVSDLVFNDLNSNGVKELGEDGIPDVRVFVDENTNGVYDAGEAYAITDTNGFYSIGGICTGVFTIAVDTNTLVAGSTAVYDPDGTSTTHRVTTNITVIQVYTNFDFGYLLPKTDLGVTKTANSDYVGTNGYAWFTITITNNGPSAATSIRLQDDWPAGIIFSNGWASASTGTFNGASMTWSNFSLAVGAGATLVITGRVQQTQIGIPLTNRVRIVYRDQYDTNPDNDKEDAVVATLIVLSRVEAFSSGSDGWVEWETSSEIGTAGFNVYRANGKGSRVKVNDAVVPAVVDAPQGGVYRVPDAGVRVGGAYTYVIEEFELDGGKREYGPFEVVAAGAGETAPVGVAGTARKNQVARVPAKADGGKGMASVSGPAKTAAPVSAAKAVTLSAAPAAPRALKLSVKSPGVYGVAAADAAAAAGATPAFVASAFGLGGARLSNRGRTIPFRSAKDGALLYFYGEGIESPYTDANVYWLTWEPGEKMVVADTPRGSTSGETTFTETTHFEVDRLAATGVVLEPEGDYWLWDYFMAGDAVSGRRTFVLHADGVAASDGKASLAVRLVSSTAAGRGRDHHVVVRLNGTVIGEDAWEGIAARDLRFSFDQALLAEGDNTVEIVSLLDAFVPYSILYLDSFDLTYRRRHEAVGDRLTFRADASRLVNVVGFTVPDVRVLDVSAPAAPKLVADVRVHESGAFYRASFKAADTSAVYCAYTPGSALAVAAMEADTASDLRSAANAARHLIVTVPALADVAERLAEHRRSRGLSSKVVMLGDIYDAFGYGIASPHAVRSFLDYALRVWSEPPRYVVLAGEGSYDYKGIKKTGDCLVPPFMIATPKSLFGTDAPYGDPDGDGTAELAVGRLPVMTAAEMDAIVDKIIAYETAPAAEWQSVATLSADVPDKGGNFTASSEATGALVPQGWSRSRVHLAEMSPADARGKLLGQINGGTAFLNFHGHGGMDTLSGRGLLKTADVASLANTNRYTVLTAMSCVIGRYDIPAYDSLAEALLLKAGGGAVAVWAPSGLLYNEPSAALGRAFYRAVLQRGEGVLGEAVMAAKADAASQGCPADSLALYNLLGDPATVAAGFDAVYGGGQAAGLSLAEWKRTGFAWDERKDEAVAGDEADPDGDGVQNLAEYAFGRNPRQAEPDALFEVAGKADDTLYDFEVRFKKNRNAVDAGAEVEVSGDLESWHGGAAYVGGMRVTDDGNGLTETVRAMVRTPDPEKRKGFIRLRVWRR